VSKTNSQEVNSKKLTSKLALETSRVSNSQEASSEGIVVTVVVSVKQVMVASKKQVVALSDEQV
jgi:hypothetical protein